MTIKDTYQTLKSGSEGVYKEKGSKFIAFAHPVKNEDDIKLKLDHYKKVYYDARHVCYAYRLGYHGEDFRQNDDGEPSGTAGKPILGQLLSNELSQVLIVIIRYFGGVKLGVGGLINAYKSAAADAIINGEIIERVITQKYELRFEYPLMNDVMRLIKDEELHMIEQEFEMSCKICLNIRLSQEERIVNRLKQLYQLKIIKLD